jgi:tetratricopeptide (TPR) repeat protein
MAPPPASPVSPPASSVPSQIIAPRTDGTARELFSRGETALLAQRWRDAADSFEALLAGEPDSPMAPAALLDLGMAYEGLARREDARDRYLELAARFPRDANARTALANACAIHAYLEEWPRLVVTAGALLGRTDLDDVDRMTGLGARGLAMIELGHVDAGAKDVEDGLDIVEETHYGALNRLPVAAAQLRFALGELRRARSELVSLDPPGPDFLAKMDSRCALLLSAQNAYADAIRSVDPHWAAMSGYRVGEMYRRLHHDLMQIPPVAAAKTERQKQLHFGMMHVRYRVLLEKGIEMMRRTLALAEKTGDASAWARRAEEAKGEMDLALEEEKAQLARLPFTEEELQKALDILQKKVTAGAASKDGGGSESRGDR